MLGSVSSFPPLGFALAISFAWNIISRLFKWPVCSHVTVLIQCHHCRDHLGFPVGRPPTTLSPRPLKSQVPLTHHSLSFYCLSPQSGRTLNGDGSIIGRLRQRLTRCGPLGQSPSTLKGRIATGALVPESRSLGVPMPSKPLVIMHEWCREPYRVLESGVGTKFLIKRSWAVNREWAPE